MRLRINLILGGLIALLSGCKPQQEIIQRNEIQVLYGPPSVFQSQGNKIDSVQPKEAIEQKNVNYK